MNPKTKKLVKKLSLQRQKFVHEYLRHGNATVAAKNAGYSHLGANAKGSQLLASDSIKAAIDVERECMTLASRASREELLAELLIMAIGDPNDCVHVDEHGVKLKTSKEMGRSRRMISSITETPGQFGRSVKVTFHDKRGAINDVWEKLGFDNLDGGRDRGAFIDAIRSVMDRVTKK